MFAFVLAVVFAITGLATIEPLFRLLGADEDTLALIAQYMSIWYLGLPLVLVPMAGIGAIRATGDSSGQSLVLVAASLANLVLDPLLIFGLAGLPRLEIEGAAIASVAARGLSVGMAFYMLHVRHGLLDLRLPGARELRESITAVLHVALPAAGTNVIIPLATGVVTAMVAAHGADAVAGFGAAFRTESVALIVFYAMSSMMGPLVGQNLGAGQAGRAQEAIAISIRFCLVFGIALAVALALAAPAIAGWFSDRPAVRETTVSFLRITSWSYGASGNRHDHQRSLQRRRAPAGGHRRVPGTHRGAVPAAGLHRWPHGRHRRHLRRPRHRRPGRRRGGMAVVAPRVAAAVGAPRRRRPGRSNVMSAWFQGFGSLRLMLLGTVAALVALGPVSGGTVSFQGVALVTTLVAPVAFAIFIFVLPLDMMMTGIFMSDADAAKRRRLKRVLITEAAALVALVLAWLPFVLSLLRIR